MPLDPAEDGDAVVRFDVPEPEVVVLRDGEEEVGVLGMKLELVDALAVPHVVLDAVHRRRVEDTHNTSRTSRRLQTKCKVQLQFRLSGFLSTWLGTHASTMSRDVPDIHRD